MTEGTASVPNKWVKGDAGRALFSGRAGLRDRPALLP
jgi:hypothetical protein